MAMKRRTLIESKILQHDWMKDIKRIRTRRQECFRGKAAEIFLHNLEMLAEEGVDERKINACSLYHCAVTTTGTILSSPTTLK